jgi:hypothetical protein
MGALSSYGVTALALPGGAAFTRSGLYCSSALTALRLSRVMPAWAGTILAVSPRMSPAVVMDPRLREDDIGGLAWSGPRGDKPPSLVVGWPFVVVSWPPLSQPATIAGAPACAVAFRGRPVYRRAHPTRGAGLMPE